ncbi:hypothetical protein [Winogradskyella sp. Asnod2-B02-A]|uniref:hypothetical protein n=1 Tax=Winogradskyella sp. Asnod2-B02-A TaxID=3160583 RepID=UPI003864CCC5
MKYRITKEDLNKRIYGKTLDGFADRFLVFIAQKQKDNNYLLSDAHILQLERKTKKRIYINSVVLSILGLFCLVLGLFQFMYTKPLIGVNLYTQFPLISNGSIEIVGSMALFVGCLYSYIKRQAILERLVKSQLIDDLKKLQQLEGLKPKPLSKKRKRFKQSYKVGNKK